MPDPFDVFLSSPAIANGIVYVGSGDQHVYALDAATGALRWSFATGDVVHASPAIADGVVYVGSWDRNVYALDAATGRERWKYTTGNDTVQNRMNSLHSGAWAPVTADRACATKPDSLPMSSESVDALRTIDRCVDTRW